MSSQNDYYRRLIESFHCAVFGLDTSGRIVGYNDRVGYFFPQAGKDLRQHPFVDLFPADRHEEIRRLITQVVNQGAFHEYEHVTTPATHEEKTLLVQLSPMRCDQGDIEGVAIWIRDITNRKVLQQQLIESERMASLGKLAAGVAHHFNNIIGGVGTVVDFALHAGNPQTTCRALEMTLEATGRMSKITDSLLTFTQQQVRPEDLADLSEVLMTFANSKEKALAQKNITLNVRLGSCPVYEVPAPRFHLLLNNLLENAVTALPEGGYVDVELKQNEHSILLSFRDNGCGICQEDLPFVFDPFFTTHDVHTGGDRQCSGLGLSVVHGIVRELQARIEVSSRQGEGTIFYIYLPRSQRIGEPA